MPQGRGSVRLRAQAVILKPKRKLVNVHGRGEYSLTRDGRTVLDAWESGMDLPLNSAEVAVLQAIATEEADKAAEKLKERE